MNDAQRLIIIIGTSLVLVMCIYPPWIYEVRAYTGVILYRDAGYGRLTSPPPLEAAIPLFELSSTTNLKTAPLRVILDLQKLGVQCFAVLVVIVGGVLLAWEKRKNSG